MRALLVPLVLLVAIGCTRDGDQPTDRGPVTPLDPSTTGSIRGVVRFEGTPPESGRLRLGGDVACTEQHEGPISARDVLVHEGRVENVFVWITTGLGERVFAVPEEPVVVDQKGCLYAPQVVGVQVGQPLRFVNSDPTLHNVHTLPERSAGVNFGMAIQGGHRDITFTKPEVMVPVRCDVHPWMRAFVGVVEHPFFDVTDKAGSFLLDGVPAGNLVVGAWHQRFGPQEATVHLEPAQEATVELVYRDPEPS